jgi:DNA-binding NarL/FixJ family response regulator
MRPISVVLAQQHPETAENLASTIEKQFLNLATVKNKEEIRNSIARHRARLAVVDLELVNFAELGELCKEFPDTAFVSMHRLADDVMWSQSLAMGAVDCCLASDLRHVLQSSDRYVAIKEMPAVSVA